MSRFVIKLRELNRYNQIDFKLNQVFLPLKILLKIDSFTAFLNRPHDHVTPRRSSINKSTKAEAEAKLKALL